ncbi:HAD family hydrolase [Fictibacillus barbaricus]|uniref:Hydrolase of the HAD superfamily n=1 Tax=Fictibacillus barbaricus TaxID=182136 RepID=A0ABU1TWB2_9BACL|nr:HAD family hydrolase [Fictibacillus barbaricus]MDR7071498.1 putative hydrolase of the HAD superfamily [Fictibacillus barbaricus]
MIKAIFFDLYETLITEWKDEVKKAVYSTNDLGLDPKVFKQEWDSRRAMRMDGTFPDHQSVLRDILSVYGKKIDNKVIEEVHQERVRAKAVPFQEMHPEVIELLKQLKTLNIKLGLISNCAPEEIMSWNTCKLPNYFDTVIFSYEAKCAKPSPQIYHIACEKLGVTPQESIFVGDGGSDELYGARDAGIQAFQAAWFLPSHMSERNKDFPKLTNPLDLLAQESIKSISV